MKKKKQIKVPKVPSEHRVFRARYVDTMPPLYVLVEIDLGFGHTVHRPVKLFGVEWERSSVFQRMNALEGCEFLKRVVGEWFDVGNAAAVEQNSINKDGVDKWPLILEQMNEREAKVWRATVDGSCLNEYLTESLLDAAVEPAMSILDKHNARYGRG